MNNSLRKSQDLNLKDYNFKDNDCVVGSHAFCVDLYIEMWYINNVFVMQNLCNLSEFKVVVFATGLPQK